MSPELIVAIKERISHGLSKEVIGREVTALGHSVEVFEAAYLLALHDQAQHTPSSYAPTSSLANKGLSSASTLLSRSWEYTLRHVWLVVWFAVPLIIASVARVAPTLFPAIPHIDLVSPLVEFAASILYVFIAAAVLYVVSHPQEEGELARETAWQFARSHTLSLLLIYILSGLIIIGGFMLLIIPGFIVLVTTYFAPYVMAHEKVTGMSALLTSRALVLGRFGAVARVLLNFLLYIFLIAFTVGLITGVISTLVDLPTTTDLISELIIQVFTAVSFVMTAYGGNTLYLELAHTRPAVSNVKEGQWKYWILVFWGPLVMILLGVLAVSLAGKDFFSPTNQEDPAFVRTELSSVQSRALTYSIENGSYEGVCDSLMSTTTPTTTIVCNDQETAWALSEIVGEDMWCADSTGYAKQINAPLQDRTVCLDL